MTTMKRTMMLLFALAALCWPAAASAQPRSVHDALTGGVIDPRGATLYVQPPRAGMVMVYRDGKAVSWLTRPGYVSLSPGRVYGVVATRGSSMLFNARYRFGPGLTSFEWSNGSLPAVSYLPSARRYPSRIGVRPPHRHGSRATTPRRPRTRSGRPARPAPKMRRAQRDDDAPRMRVAPKPKRAAEKKPALTPKRPAETPERAAPKRRFELKPRKRLMKPTD